MDHFKDWWRPQLMLLGYDSVWKQRPKKRDTYYEGVAVAYRRSQFQLFKSVMVDLNKSSEQDTDRGSSFKERLITDDVGLLLFLQPWCSETLDSALCVGSVAFSNRQGDDDVRFFQCQYFTKRVELANREFQLPVILGVALYDQPTSSAYHLLRTGRAPIKPQAPGKPRPPFGKATCRGSTKIQWFPPKIRREDPPITAYRIAWRPGGSLTLGFKAQTEITPGEAIQYKEKIGKKGVRKLVAMEELCTTITGLTSELPFEFIVTAINEVGEGIWSDPSMPIVMPNPPKAPKMPPLVNLRSTQEVTELREQFTMGVNDWDVEAVIDSNPVNSSTQLTPRLIDGRRDIVVPRGRVLPTSVNPREGWKDTLHGGQDGRVLKELGTLDNMHKTILRSLEDGTFVDRVTDSPRSRRAMILDVKAEESPFTFNARYKETYDPLGLIGASLNAEANSSLAQESMLPAGVTFEDSFVMGQSSIEPSIAEEKAQERETIDQENNGDEESVSSSRVGTTVEGSTEEKHPPAASHRGDASALPSEIKKRGGINLGLNAITGMLKGDMF